MKQIENLILTKNSFKDPILSNRLRKVKINLDFDRC
jgi:hypothetical protein